MKEIQLSDGSILSVDACSWVKDWVTLSVSTDRATSEPLGLDMSDISLRSDGISFVLSSVDGEEDRARWPDLLFPLDSGRIDVVLSFVTEADDWRSSVFYLSVGSITDSSGEAREIPRLRLQPPNAWLE
jgi:hypothetical protein